jgi:hypothetical protein
MSDEVSDEISIHDAAQAAAQARTMRHISIVMSAGVQLINTALEPVCLLQAVVIGFSPRDVTVPMFFQSPPGIEIPQMKKILCEAISQLEKVELFRADESRPQ